MKTSKREKRNFFKEEEDKVCVLVGSKEEFSFEHNRVSTQRKVKKLLQNHLQLAYKRYHPTDL